MSLIEYRKKRNFKNTKEPKGKVTQSKNTQFVIQYHQARTNHYDFRLEHKGVLLSWAIPKGLTTTPNEKRLAIHVEDHPLEYAKFSGTIPKGNYGAGTVEIFDNGTYIPLINLDQGLKKGHIKIYLNGKKFKGAWSLIKFKDDNWFAVKIHDKHANDAVAQSTTLPFKSATVQLATSADKVPSGKNWIFEIKYDGYRIVSFVENGRVKMLTRNEIDYTSKLNSIAENLKQIDASNFILDGEVVCFDESGRSDFGLLQHNLKSKSKNLYYCVFDLLALNGQDLRQEPLIERKEKLEKLLSKTATQIIYADHTTNGAKTLAFARAHNLEGIIAKQRNAKYKGKRCEDWLKIKCYGRQEFVIIGYTTTIKNQILSAIVLGYYLGKSLMYAGKVGTGFTEKTKQQLIKAFQALTIKQCPLTISPKVKNVVWLKPTLVAEIQFAEFTKDNILRQPSFIGLRHDKCAKDVVLEQR